MPRNRFQQLTTQLHFVNNSSLLDEQKKDKLWKIRPWLDSLRDQCLKVTAEERNSIDEMMVQYRGTTSPIRQYIKSKPHLWRFKVWGRAGTSGMLFDFDIYQGDDGTRSHLGQGGDVVMKLVSTLAKNSNYKIYADNLFTSVPLLEKLLGWGLQYTGTVRQNRLSNCNIKGEKELKKEGRGSFDFRVEDTHNISAVR
ncbi:piggyBac transposable element-derived protein 3-like [Watersipora subatra]|uniref:piggyBac transposable element-derived protein 3-like n=1 Tax=Watersipora subatra TaxID=2589382 RepID=UPI00355BBFDE